MARGDAESSPGPEGESAPSDPDQYEWYEEGSTRWVLEHARINWAATERWLVSSGMTEDEQRALAPVLRRQAVLQATSPSRLELRGWLLAAIGVIGLLWIGMPLIVVAAAGQPIGRSVILVYVFYLLAQLAWLVAAGLCWMLALLFLNADEWPKGWLGSVALVVVATPVSAGCALLFDYLRRVNSPLAAGIVAATLSVLFGFLLAGVSDLVAQQRERRRAGIAGLNDTATLIVLEEWQTLCIHRPNWRGLQQRRRLVSTLRDLEQSVAVLMDRSVRANHGDVQARVWAESFSWRLSQSLRDHRYLVLQIDRHPQYLELVSKVRRQLIELAAGSWESFPSAGEAAPRLTLRRLVARAVVPVVLGAAAVGVEFLPGIDSDSLTTIRLSLAIPAVLSVLPVKNGAQSALGEAFRDALGRWKS